MRERKTKEKFEPIKLCFHVHVVDEESGLEGDLSRTVKVALKGGDIFSADWNIKIEKPKKLNPQESSKV